MVKMNFILFTQFFVRLGQRWYRSSQNDTDEQLGYSKKNFNGCYALAGEDNNVYP
jgi:hypothetical protein